MSDITALYVPLAPLASVAIVTLIAYALTAGYRR